MRCLVGAEEKGGGRQGKGNRISRMFRDVPLVYHTTGSRQGTTSIISKSKKRESCRHAREEGRGFIFLCGDAQLKGEKRRQVG